MNVCEALHRLRSEKCIPEELYGVVLRFAKAEASAQVEAGKCPPSEKRERAFDLAGNFIVALSSEEISDTVETVSGLKRVFKRYCLHVQNPQGRELWNVISEALRALEKEGLVCRMAPRKQKTNSNDVLWALSAHAERPGCLPSSEEIASIMPKFKARGDHDKILKPSEIESILISILRMAKGRVSMGDLMHHIQPHVFMLRDGGSIDQNASGEGHTPADDEGIRGGLHEIYGDDHYRDDGHILIRDETEHRSRLLLAAIEAIPSGRRRTLSAHQLLCNYYLPKVVLDRKVVMEDFGPTSTVSDIVNKLETLLAAYLPPTSHPDPRESWIASQINKAMLNNLFHFCSEKGCPLDFNADIGRAAAGNNGWTVGGTKI